MRTELSQSDKRQNRLVFGGLIGVITFLILEILGLSELDDFLQIALALSSIALPLLALQMIVLSEQDRFDHDAPEPKFVPITQTIAALLSFGAFASVFFHFGIPFGTLFCTISVLSFFLFRRFYKDLRQSSKK